MDLVMEKAKGKVHLNPEQSFLATLSNPQVTLLSMHKRCSFRRSSGVGGLARLASSEEKVSSQPEEEGGVLTRTLERSSQVSTQEDRLRGSQTGAKFATGGSSRSPMGRGLAL